jgi:hypothetical protein
VRVLSSAPAAGTFEELALINARSGQSIFDGKDLDAMLPDMKAEACRLGADALIIRSVEEGGVNWAGPADRGHASATAIRFRKRTKSM